MANEEEKRKSGQEDEISLRDLVLKIRSWVIYLWNKKWLVIAAGIFGAFLGLGYSLIKKPVYIATTTFVLESGEKSGGLSAYSGVASMMGIDIGGGGGGIFQGDNILELYKSRTMIEKALYSLLDSTSKETLLEKYIEISKLREAWEKTPELRKIQFAPKDFDYRADPKAQRLKDSIVGKIVADIVKSNLSVAKPDKKLSIIKVDVKSTDEVFAKRFNEELVKNVNDFYIQTKTKKSLENVAILKHKADSVRGVMNGAILSAASVADATPNLNLTRQVQRVAPVQRAQFSAETNKSILGEMVKNLEMSNIALMKETPLIQIIDKPIYPIDVERFGKLKGIIMGLLTASLITILIILVKRIYNEIINNEN